MRCENIVARHYPGQTTAHSLDVPNRHAQQTSVELLLGYLYGAVMFVVKRVLKELRF